MKENVHERAHRYSLDLRHRRSYHIGDHRLRQRVKLRPARSEEVFRSSVRRRSVGDGRSSALNRGRSENGFLDGDLGHFKCEATPIRNRIDMAVFPERRT